MSDEVRNVEPAQLAQELDSALSVLDGALSDAYRSVTLIRNNVAQLASLAQVLQEVDAAMSKAKASIASGGAPLSAATPLRAVPPQPAYEPQPQPVYEPPTPVAPPAREESWSPPVQEQTFTPPVTQAEVPEPVQEAEPETETFEPAAFAQEAEQPQAEAEGTVSHCLRLGVSSKSGSLDLKAVDGSVNENPSVVDVALLDYDGRQATLKLWIQNEADPQGVRESLMASLRRRLGDEGDADVRIDFEQGSAA